MGTSTDAILAYGYDLGGPEEWKIEEVDERGLLQLDWFDEDNEDGEDLIGVAEERLLTWAGFTETDWRAEGYHARKRAAEARIGVGFTTHCFVDAPMYLLTAKVIEASRSWPRVVEPKALGELAYSGRWADQLARALKALGMTPKQKDPAWILCSYWSYG